jgi:hypothetical protein
MKYYSFSSTLAAFVILFLFSDDTFLEAVYHPSYSQTFLYNKAV